MGEGQFRKDEDRSKLAEVLCVMLANKLNYFLLQEDPKLPKLPKP